MRIFGFLLIFLTKINTNSAKSCLLFRRKAMPVFRTARDMPGQNNKQGDNHVSTGNGAANGVDGEPAPPQKSNSSEAAMGTGKKPRSNPNSRRTSPHGHHAEAAGQGEWQVVGPGGNKGQVPGAGGSKRMKGPSGKKQQQQQHQHQQHPKGSPKGSPSTLNADAFMTKQQAKFGPKFDFSLFFSIKHSFFLK
jgi:hypothetical protein